MTNDYLTTTRFSHFHGASFKKHDTIISCNTNIYCISFSINFTEQLCYSEMQVICKVDSNYMEIVSASGPGTPGAGSLT